MSLNDIAEGEGGGQRERHAERLERQQRPEGNKDRVNKAFM
jgi:hypothetical protein